MRRAITFLASGAYVGYMPVAPGTFGSLIALPFVAGVAHLELPVGVTIALLATVCGLAMVVCDRAGRFFGEADSGHIVLDEVCGMLVAGALRPATAGSLAVTFILFRIFDVLKPFPASYIDRTVKNGVGVVGDDLVAGLYTNLVARVLM